jgi:hypothetical protein
MIKIKDLSLGTRVSVNRLHFPGIIPIGTLGTIRKDIEEGHLLIMFDNGRIVPLSNNEEQEIDWLDIAVSGEIYWKIKVKKAAEISTENGFCVYDEEFWTRQPGGVISLLIKVSGMDFPYVIEM